jgi:DNA-binding NarL/FixJ family response regulator
MKIFIADDSSLLRAQLSELLCELEGIEIVGQAAGVEQALDAIRALRPDVITLDIQMSDGSGIDLLKKIKKENPAPLVIMVTNHASPPYRKQCKQEGADYFFDKAIEINEVKRIIRDLLLQFKRTDD